MGAALETARGYRTLAVAGLESKRSPPRPWTWQQSSRLANDQAAPP